MIKRFLSLLLFTLQMIGSNFGQEANINLDNIIVINDYYQEVVTDVHVMDDSSMVTISHITKQANDSTFRMALYRHISYEGELLGRKEYEFSANSSLFGFNLETFNFVSHFSDEDIFIVSVVGTLDCTLSETRSFKLFHIDYDGNVLEEKTWCRDKWSIYNRLAYNSNDSTLYAGGLYGSHLDSLDTELTKIHIHSNDENEVIKLSPSYSTIRYLDVRNDRVFAAGTFNYRNQAYGPMTSWSGYIQEDSIQITHDFSYFKDWQLSNLIWQGDEKQYLGSADGSDASLLQFENNKFNFNVLEGNYTYFHPMAKIGSGYIIPHFSYVELITSDGVLPPQIGFYILDNAGVCISKKMYPLTDLLYSSETVQIGDRIYVFAKLDDISGLVNQKTHCYIFEIVE